MYKEVSQQLMSFIQQSPTAFHAVDTMKKMLNEAGYQELSESQKWIITKGGKYYVTRNQSSLIAFHIGEKLDHYNFHLEKTFLLILHQLLYKFYYLYIH